MSNNFLFGNNVSTTLAESVSPTATVLNVASGAGSLFPQAGNGAVFALTLVDAATGLTNEICYCTSRSSDQLTVVRGRESTSATSFSAGDTVAMFLTAGILELYPQAGLLAPFSFTFAQNIGGYPQNAIVADATTVGKFWVSTASNNTTTPGSNGANWQDLLSPAEALISAETTRAKGVENNLAVKLASLGAPQVYTASTSITVPQWATRALIRVIGGGGDGNGCYASTTTQISGGGGGAGGDACGMFGIGAGTALVITVGAQGGTSSVAWEVSPGQNYQIFAYGGNNSVWNSNGFTSAGAGGGVAGGGNLWNFTGGTGSDGQYSKSQNGFFAGNGAPGPFGGGGRAGEAGGAGGTSFGAGGGGAYDPNATATQYYGGSGYQGAVIVTFFP